MKIKAIVPYFGGKRTLAPVIVERLGAHISYVEPFCGSLAVLFAKPMCAGEIVNDLHGDLVNLALVLASDCWADLYERIDRFLMSETLVADWRGQLESDYAPPETVAQLKSADVVRAAMYAGISWICRNGASGTKRTSYQMAIRWTQGGGGQGTRWRSAVESVPDWHDRLKGVTILRRDGIELLGKIKDEPGTAIYVDPPYLKSTRSGGGGSRYLYDFDDPDNMLLAGQDDHVRLAEVLRRFKKATVVVSYYAHPRLAELYTDHGWKLEAFTRQKTLSRQNMRGAATSVAPEVLLSNTIT